MGIYPNNSEDLSKQNLQIQTYGRRIFNSQTVPEYFLEFLLVFLGKASTTDERIGFNKIDDLEKPTLDYIKNANIGLKRFILYKKTKLESRFDVDTDAYKAINEILKHNIDTESYSEETILEIVRDLLSGFSLVSGNRGWFAQTLMPLCREMVFCEAIGSKGTRTSLNFYDEYGNVIADTEKKFEFKQYSFLARGGECYFIHLLQGLNYISKKESIEKAIEYKNELDTLILKLIDSYDEFSQLSRWILNNWYSFLAEKSDDEALVSKEDVEKSLIVKSKCQWISSNYERRSAYSVKELNNILKADINEFEKINLISKGIVFQILRMMSESAYIDATGDTNGLNRSWVVHLDTKHHANSKVRKLAVENYKSIEENMISAVAKKLNSIDYTNQSSEGESKGKRKKVKTEAKLLEEAYNDSHKLLRKLGKDIGIIIPLKGDNMRFTLSDDIVRFFVLSLIEPNSKMTLDTFLNKIYKQFGVIIGPKQYYEFTLNSGENEDASYLKCNLEEFQVLLKMNGFLKELSDATSMVINPYGNIMS